MLEITNIFNSKNASCISSEGEIIPYHALSSLGGGAALILAPHADDEVFGCGGAIMRHVAAGAAVRVVILTDGAAGQDAQRTAYIAQRRQESQAAAQILGYGEPLFWDYPDRELPYDETVVQRVCTLVEAGAARWLYAPSPYELHPDHRHLSLVALEVLRRHPHNLSLAFYEISAPLPPNRLLDISDIFERKQQAIQCFSSQLARQNYATHVEALNRYRTYTLPSEVQAAEAYWVLEGYALLHSPQPPYLGMVKNWPIAHVQTIKAAPLVSVIVRTIGRATLAEALHSLALQTYSQLEIVVVDARGTGELHFAQGQYRFPLRVVGTGQALGASAAANVGLDHAHGEYLIFLDDDDWFLPGHIAGLMDALLAHPHMRVAYGAVECLQRDAQGAWKSTHIFKQPFDRTRLLIENYIPIHAALFQRSLLERGCRIDESLTIYEDWDFWLQLAQHTDFAFVNQVGGVYRIGQSSGFGLAGQQLAVERGLHALFAKWRQRWSTAQVVALAEYAKHYSMYHEVRELLDVRSQELNATVSAMHSARAEAQDAHAREQAALVREQAAEQIAQQRIRALEQTLDEQQVLMESQAQDAERISAQLREMETSSSWKLTAPLRALVIFTRHCAWNLRLLFYFSKQNLSLAQQIWHAQGTRALLGRGWRKLGRMITDRKQRTPLATTQWQLASRTYPLTFAHQAQPQVSIVIPVHNQALYTFSCLKSLLEHASAYAVEIIVVDDHSEAQTQHMLEQITGIRVLRNSGERGFVNACNLGAAQAQGEYLVFLNNDTAVLPGWLEALLAIFERYPSAGLVGARLIYPDGRLQSAGGVLWRDGSAAHVGWGDVADAPEYGYVRKVDYCPGACIAIPRGLFATLGGFSAEFAPAYYEDADLAFKVRQAGREVYYQPQALILHVEGASMGQNSLSGFKRFQVLHRQVFQKKWVQQLASHALNNGQALAARDRQVWKRVLVVDKVMLTPDQDAGSLRMVRLLEELVGLGAKVTFVTLYVADREPYRNQLQQLGVEVLYPPRETTVRGYLQRCGRNLDAVLLSRADVAEQLLGTVRELAPQARCIFDTVDLHYLREERMAQLQASPVLAQAAAARKRVELGLMQQADVTLVVSPFEQALLAQELPTTRIEVLSTIHEPLGCAAEYAQRAGLLFIGGFNHPPNVDAMLYYAAEIAPQIERELGAIKTWIIGSNPPAEILALASETLLVEGFVEDVSAHFARARLSIAPLRYGAGVKGKINTSMAYGVPVIATPIAAEGMALTDGVDVLIGADAASFAAAVIRAYRDAHLWEQLSANGMRNLEQHFSRHRARQTLAALLD